MEIKFSKLHHWIILVLNWCNNQNNKINIFLMQWFFKNNNQLTKKKKYQFTFQYFLTACQHNILYIFVNYFQCILGKDLTNTNKMKLRRHCSEQLIYIAVKIDHLFVLDPLIIKINSWLGFYKFYNQNHAVKKTDFYLTWF